MKKLSFKMRITVFAGIIVLVTALSLALLSMYNAKRQIAAISGEAIIPDPMSTPAVAGEFYIEDTSVTISQTDVLTLSEASRQFNYTSILYTSVIAVIGMIGAYLFAGSALKPIRRLNNAIVNITDKNLNQRLPETHSNDEISSLTNSFNSMLDRLDDSFTRQKQFSSNAAHELKTPVAVIKTSLQTLRMEKEPERTDYEDVLKIIERNTKRLSDIIDDLLTLTNGSADLTVEMISINAMLVCVVNDLLPQYRKRDIKIKYDFDKEECFTECAETLAYRLFYNLIENAFKYNNDGGSILISVKNKGGKYQVIIKDDGIGIPKEQISHIWEPFYCVDKSHSRKYGGSGLGLSVVKEISERFGWNIQVCSEKGKGSEFIVEVTSL